MVGQRGLSWQRELYLRVQSQRVWSERLQPSRGCGRGLPTYEDILCLVLNMYIVPLLVPSFLSLCLSLLLCYPLLFITISIDQQTHTFLCLQLLLFKYVSVARVKVQWRGVSKSTTTTMGGAPSVTILGPSKMLTWHVECSTSRQLLRSLERLRSVLVVALSGWTMSYVMATRALSFSVPTTEWAFTTANTLKMLGWSVQVSFDVILLWQQPLAVLPPACSP